MRFLQTQKLFRKVIFLVWLLSIAMAMSAFGQSTNDYMSLASGNWTTYTSWQKWNGSAWAACSVGDYPNSTARSVTVQNGHTIVVNASAKSVKNLTINSGGKIWGNAAINGTGSNIVYVVVYGNIVCNGTIGSTGANADILGLDTDGSSMSITGSGTFAPCRLRKGTSTNTTTNLTLGMDAYITYTVSSATGLYNNTANTTFNVTQSAGYSLSILGSVAVDGVDGTASSDRSGTFTFNGTVTIGGTLYLTSNNSIGVLSSISIGTTGTVNASTVYAGASGGLGVFTFTNNGILNITGDNTSTIAYPIGTSLTSNGGLHNLSLTNNSYVFGSGSLIQFSANGAQAIATEITYKNLQLTGSGNKTVAIGMDLNIEENLTISASSVLYCLHCSKYYKSAKEIVLFKDITFERLLNFDESIKIKGSLS